MDMKKIQENIKKRKIEVGVIGLGYVGLPLVIRFAEEGFSVTGFDIDPVKIEKLKKGISYINHIPSEKIKSILPNLKVTTEMKLLKKVDAMLICVPTPLTAYREPNTAFLEKTASDIYTVLRKGHIVSLESTTYPGTTREIFYKLFQKKGLKIGKDYFLIYSPEREDPGNPVYQTKDIPKLVGGITKNCSKIGITLYSAIIKKVIPVSSPEIAESSKLLENIYRAVNIALVNELKLLFDRMGINIWEVIGAAKTKPFGFQPFYPGPGLGGHCIPVDPFYLTWKAREYDFHTRFIELAGEINISMPYYVVEKTIETLSQKGKSIRNAKILLIGIAYKKDVDDIRESPAFKIMKIFLKKEAKVDYYDPFVEKVEKTRQFSFPVYSIKFNKTSLKKYDAAVIVTDHSCIDYKMILKYVPVVVDTRNVFKKVSSKITKA